MMPPPAPPNRAAAGAFHYHTYSYPGDALAGPFAPWAAPLPINAQMYSLEQDLIGLQAWGAAVNGVPNLALTRIAALPGGAQTIGNRDTIMLSLGPGPGVVNAPAVVFTAGVHAREWIAIEFVYLLAEYLVRHYTNVPVTRYQRMIKSLVDSRRIYIIPMLNPNGNFQTVFGAGAAAVVRLWRKNRHVLPVNAPAWVAMLTAGLAPGNNNPVPFQNVVDPGGGGLATYDVPNYDPDNGIPPAPALPPAGRVTRQLANNAVGVDANRNFRTLGWSYDGQRHAPGMPVISGRAWDPTAGTYFGPRPGGRPTGSPPTSRRSRWPGTCSSS
jgi:hypothetical protein